MQGWQDHQCPEVPEQGENVAAEHRMTCNLLPTSAQWVPEPDPLPGIFFDTRPDPIQF